MSHDRIIIDTNKLNRYIYAFRILWKLSNMHSYGRSILKFGLGYPSESILVSVYLILIRFRLWNQSISVILVFRLQSSNWKNCELSNCNWKMFRCHLIAKKFDLNINKDNLVYNIKVIMKAGNENRCLNCSWMHFRLNSEGTFKLKQVKCYMKPKLKHKSN